MKSTAMTMAGVEIGTFCIFCGTCQICEEFVRRRM